MKQARLQLLRIIIATLTLTLPAMLRAQEAKPAPSETHALKSTIPLIVIGFAGGFIKRTSTVHGEVALAQHLREKYGPTIHAEIFENHRSNEAHTEILHLVATSPQKPRIILYGHSWGASEAVNEARRLQRDNIPVLLLIAVDGVPKRSHDDDSIIPANVAQAINFYQTEGLLHGRPTIHAADPAATKILGNIRLSYKDHDVPTPGYPWIARTFTKRHIEIENDPAVWNQIETLILSHLAEPQKDFASTQLLSDANF
jgi:pimeloyl-ACP methyl ester carboxylesterase